MKKADREALSADFDSEQIGDRSPSASMLAWFLTHVERLDPELIPDAICDGRGDKGIDAIVIDDDLNEIILYQAKRMTSPSKKQGDNDLKLMIGSSQSFNSAATVEALLDSKPNVELRNLILRNDVAGKLDAGYKVRRLVYVTNSELDPAAQSLLEGLDLDDRIFDMWDGPRLTSFAVRIRRADLKAENVSLSASSPPLLDELDGKAKLAVAIIPAQELVTKLPGIHDLTLFDRNVRYSVGNTRINKELAKTIADPSEHLLFPASHNGITILTAGVSANSSQIDLDGVSVVNGCQSLLALHKNSSSLTPDLKLLVKIVELPDVTSTLSDVITYRANNQNAVNIRDQRSTDSIQIGLQRQVTEVFGSKFGYRIKVGDSVGAENYLDNTLAAQLITAIYRQMPWAAVRKVRLFDQDYHEVFTRSIDAHKLYLLWLIDRAVTISRDELRGELRSSFSSVRFTVAAMLAEIIRLTPAGEQLLEYPQKWLPDKTADVSAFLEDRARDVAINIRDYVADAIVEAAETGADFDAKTVFKSVSGVAPLKREINTVSRRLGSRDPGYLFTVDPD